MQHCQAVEKQCKIMNNKKRPCGAEGGYLRDVPQGRDDNIFIKTKLQHFASAEEPAGKAYSDTAENQHEGSEQNSTVFVRLGGC